jgi:hypothetical protein
MLIGQFFLLSWPCPEQSNGAQSLLSNFLGRDSCQGIHGRKTWKEANGKRQVDLARGFEVSRNAVDGCKQFCVGRMEEDNASLEKGRCDAVD